MPPFFSLRSFMQKEKFVVFDGDLIVFNIACAGEKRGIKVTHKRTGRSKEFKNVSEFYGRGKNKDGGWLGERNEGRAFPFLVEDFSIEVTQVPEPLHYTLGTVKRYINNTLEKLGATRYIVYLGEGACHRHDIDLPIHNPDNPLASMYKGQRDTLIKPVYFQEVRDYLVSSHSAQIVTGIETDDKVSMLAWEGHLDFLKSGDIHDNPYIIVTKDKDHFGVEGWLYNPDLMSTPEYIEGFGRIYLNDKGKPKGRGRVWKYFQLLFGDQVDNYYPKRTPLKTYRLGEKEVFKNLVKCKDDKECLEYAISVYKDWLPEEVEYTSCFGNKTKDDWFSWMQKMADMVHMLRYEGDRWDLKEEFEKYGVTYEAD